MKPRRRRPRGAAVAFALLAALLGIAYAYDAVPATFDAYLHAGGEPAALAGSAPPALLWTRELALPAGGRLVALGAGADRLLAAVRLAGLHVRWIDPLGHGVTERSLPAEPAVWVVSGDDLLTADRAQGRGWTLRAESSAGSAALDGFDADARFAELQLVPLDAGGAAVIGYTGFSATAGEVAAGAGPDAGDAWADRVSLYRRGVGDGRDGSWRPVYHLVYRDGAVMQVVSRHGAAGDPGVGNALASGSELAVLRFVPAPATGEPAESPPPFRLEVRDEAGETQWQRPLPAPGWRLAFVAILHGRTAVWAWREDELVLLGEGGARSLGRAGGRIERCWPVAPSGREAACVEGASTGSRRLAFWDERGRRGPVISLEDARWWALAGAGVLIARDGSLSFVDGSGRTRWSLSLPFLPAEVAYGFGRLLLSDGRSLALLAWPRR